MITPRGMGVVELDQQASEVGKPFGIITVDGSSPHEIDDGLFVRELSAPQETYQVGVCVADTSKLYNDGTILKDALRKTESQYWELPNGRRAHEPMIPQDIVESLHFAKGTTRSALMVSFIVGRQQPPSDVTVEFGKVQVRENITYKEFGRRCRYSPSHEKFGRAGAYILQHLGCKPEGDWISPGEPQDPDSTYNRLIHVPNQHGWMRGARLNETYMIAANFLVAQMMRAEGRAAIYRVHDPARDSQLEFLPPTVARFSRTPGPHEGLGLPIYSRVTSPLRRLEDFIMSYHLKQRHLGRDIPKRDVKIMAAAVQRLNQRVVSEVLRGPLRLETFDVLGRAAMRGVLDEAAVDANVMPMFRDEATA